MFYRLALAPVFGLLLLAAACGSVAAVSPDVGGPAGGACLQGATDCDDVGVDPDGSTGDGGGICSPDVTDGCDPIPGDTDEAPGDLFPVEQARDDAHAVLGMNEADLAADVRVSRRGGETFALTEDYRLGRLTVELDDLDDSGFRVVSVTVELPDGPESFDLQPG